MGKAVFTTKVTPGYKDLPEVRYHFPRTYLNQARQSIGDHIVYYEPRRSSVDLSSGGGRQSYFAVARVIDVVEDKELANHFYAVVDNYLDFDRPSRLPKAQNTTRARSRKPTAVRIRVHLDALYGQSPTTSSTGY